MDKCSSWVLVFGQFITNVDSLLNSEIFLSTEDQTGAEGDSKGVSKRPSPCTIAFMFNDLRDNDKICPTEHRSGNSNAPEGNSRCWCSTCRWQHRMIYNQSLENSLSHWHSLFTTDSGSSKESGEFWVWLGSLKVWLLQWRVSSAPTKKISCNCKYTLFTFHRWNDCGFDQGPRWSMQHQGTVCKGGKWLCWYRVPWRPAVNAALIHWYMFYFTLKNTWLKQPKQACYMLMLQSNV